MSGLLLSAFVVLVLVAGACLLGALLLVAPFVRALDLAERRQFSPSRWGAASVGAAGLAAGAAYALRDAPRVLLVLPLALTWAVPAALSVLNPSQQRIGGRPGRHE